MNERVIDRALLEALSKADPGPYPRKVPYAATLRQYLPDPVTAFRWATWAAAGTVVLGGAALVVKAMGIDHQAPPMGLAEPAESRALPEAGRAMGSEVAVTTATETAATAPTETAMTAATETAATAATETAMTAATMTATTAVTTKHTMVKAEPPREPIALAAEDVAKVAVVPAAYEPRHAKPDLDLNLLGMTVAVDVS